MSVIHVPARARVARAVWAACVLLLATSAFSSNSSQAPANSGQELPVVGTVPADGAVKVRPDSAISFQLDSRAPDFRAFRQQVELGRFAILVDDGSSPRLFVGEQRGQSADAQVTAAGTARFDAQAGTLSTPALSLQRYTTYTVTLAVKAAYEALLHGQPLPGNDAVTFAFVTGSALHEPTHYLLTTECATALVTEKARLTVSATDDYGNAAWGSSVAVNLTEDGSRLLYSAVATPAQALLPEPGGVVSFDVTDTEAEGVQAAVQATGAHPENAWSGSAALRFRPGQPDKAVFIDLPKQQQVATKLTVQGAVVDLYGNPVEDGTPLSVNGQPVITRDGLFTYTVTLPTTAGSYVVQVQSGTAVLATAFMRLLPGDPDRIDLQSLKQTATVGSGYAGCIKVLDAYGNGVADGTPFTVNGTRFLVQSWGSGCFSLPTPTKSGPMEVRFEAGAATASLTVQLAPGLAQNISGLTAPASVPGLSTYQVCGLAADKYDNAVVDGTRVLVDVAFNGRYSLLSGRTEGGRFCFDVTAPGAPGTQSLTFRADFASAATTVTITPPPPASMTLYVTTNANESPDGVLANGTSAATLTAYVFDAAGQPVVDGTPVTFSTTLGTVNSPVTTQGGVASASVRSSTAGTATVTARAGSVVSTQPVKFIIAPANLTVSVSLPSTAVNGVIPADGSSAAILTATVTDALGQPVSTSLVSWSTNLGTLSASSVLPTYGSATVTLKSVTTGTATVTVKVGSLIRTVTAQFRVREPSTITVATSLPSNAPGGVIPADGSSSATLTATVTDTFGQQTSNVPVFWSTTLGSLSASTTYTVNGKASAALKSGYAGTATVTVTAGSISRTVTVQFAYPPSNLTVSASLPANAQSGAVPADGSSAATLSAYVTDVYGQPVSAFPVTWTTTLGTLSASSTTPVGGSTSVTLKSTTAGTATVTVKAGNITRTVSVQFVTAVAQPANVFLSVSMPSTSQNGAVPADGTSAAGITAYVYDGSGNGMSSVPVTWSTTLGTLSATSTTTQSGMTSVMLTSSTAGTATITAKAGSITRTITVTFFALSTGPSITGLTLRQPSWYGTVARMNYGSGNYWRVKAGYTVNVSGTAYEANGTPARSKLLTVKLAVDYGGSQSVSVYTDAYGYFNATYLQVNYGGWMYGMGYYDSNNRYVYDYWDFGTLTISAGTQTYLSEKVYVVDASY